MKVERRIHSRFLDDKGGGIPLMVYFTWDSDDPLALRLGFPQESQNINWVIARELLYNGMTEPSGDLVGDVACWPIEPNKMVLSLRPPSGRADIELHMSQIRQFLDETTAITPIGEEGARIEAAMENFLASIRERGA